MKCPTIVVWLFVPSFHNASVAITLALCTSIPVIQSLITSSGEIMTILGKQYDLYRRALLMHFYATVVEVQFMYFPLDPYQCNFLIRLGDMDRK